MADGKKAKEKGSTIGLFHRVKVIGKDGKTKYDSGEKKSDSFVKNFMACLANLLTDNHLLSNLWTDHGGAPRSGAAKSTWDISRYPFSTAAFASYDFFGIRVGTGDTPVSSTDVDLDTLIENGVGAGQLSYTAQTWIDTVESGGNVDSTWIRSFSNGSGGTIVVAEIGMSIILAGAYYCLILRDVLTSTVSVSNGEVLIVEYIWRTAVTA